MSCAETKKYLDAYIDSELEAEIMIEVESHLAECGSCFALNMLKRRMKEEVASLGERIVAPEIFRQKIQTLSTHRRRTRLWTVAAASIPLAAAATLMFVLNLNADAGKDSMTAVVDDVINRHIRDLPMEVDGADTGKAASWFRGKVDFPVRAPNLHLKNASFKGARLSNVRSNQAAHMLYNVDGHKVTLMIFPTDSVNIKGGNTTIVNGKKVVLGRRNGFNVAVMINGDMAYALSSDLPTRRLLSLFTDTNI